MSEAKDTGPAGRTDQPAADKGVIVAGDHAHPTENRPEKPSPPRSDPRKDADRPGPLVAGDEARRDDDAGDRD